MNTSSTHSHSPVSLESLPTLSFTEPILSPSFRTLSLSSNPCSGTTPHISEDKGRCTIATLTDNVFLEIFYFYQDFYRINPDVIDPSYRDPVMRLSEWRRLLHVCRRWRQIIFGSPRRLNLQIRCTPANQFKKSLGIWPDVLIAIDYRDISRFNDSRAIEEDDIIAALGHPDRVCHIELGLMGSQLENMATVLRKPFPVLTCLDIGARDVIHSEGLVLPSGFLGGSAPCLQEFYLSSISFPDLPMFLSSAKNLVSLDLSDVPPTGFISPNALIACLTELPRLDALSIGFGSADVRLGQRHPPPITRTVLPALANLYFFGACEYQEDLVAKIDCPKLARVDVAYYGPVHDFQVTQLSKFIDRSGQDQHVSPSKPSERRGLGPR